MTEIPNNQFTSSQDVNFNLRHRKTLILKIAAFCFFTGFLVFLYIISAPYDFPMNKIITIEKGITLKEAAKNLKEENLIRSSFLFDIFLRYSGYESDIKAGKYLFEKKMTIFSIMSRLIKGEYDISALKITIPEGSTIKDINRIFSENGFKSFEIKDQQLEGYLFPDTYFFSVDAIVEDAIKKMKENFEKKIADLRFDIQKSGRTFNQILIMASLVEKEAADYSDREIVSGILWRRLDNKFPLQVDAVFAYIIGKSTFELTMDDLKIDSPYNTYRKIGLPPTPICNPGLDAIKAAVSPEKSLYWYYLSDKEGKIYYSKTFEEHKINKAKYL